ncbi:iron ABC transporter permease [Sporosarcina sp. JAI121]|uniref:FecCD family ABC transporter permease n=1 Tax=Sporosarcina sp. JAI121 TaxID=2723064 RepID=UPI0015CA8DA1|nr:iron ABC transporter permease [Sporosarcina sp. JAI121]NYF24034.1 iron complex transport system permease protein [Sporosarcina sp. JAI121]
MLNYWLQQIPYSIKIGMSLILLIVSFGMALVFGAADTSVRDVLTAILSTAPSDQAIMLREIRFPREVAAALVGAALAVSGAIIQGMTRNPLADPGLLGLTAGANAALAITVAFWPSVNYFGVMMTCFVGAAAGAILVFGFSSFHPEGFTTLRIVLAGATISAFLYAIAEGVGIYFKISQQVSMWTAGGMIGTTWNQVLLIAPIVFIGVIISMMCARQLTILSLSEEMAVGLGQRVRLIKSILFVLVIILTGASVALVGNLAFFGLMVPHIVRAIVGTDYRFVLPMSAILGATFMLLADTVARSINAPYETPVAAVVAIMGLPFFLYIVRKGGQSFS